MPQQLPAIQPPTSPRASRGMIWVAILSILLILGWTVPSQMVIERPGPVVDTLGEIELDGEATPVISIDGVQTHPTDGELNLLTVSINGSPENQLGWLSLLPVLFDPSQTAKPISEVFPEGVTSEDRNEQNKLMMEKSQADATASALRALGIDFTARVVVQDVVADLPADGLLQPGDEILSVAGAPITGAGGLRAALADAGVGTPVTLGILRDGQQMDVTATPEQPKGATAPILGITVSAEYEFPVDVTMHLDRIGGPSAGLMFALGIGDELTEESLTGGHIISGTGTIDDTGRVGAIGGLPQKMWGASRVGTELFLMPLGNCAQVPATVPGDMIVAPVATLDEALQAIDDLNAGRVPAGLERCPIESSGDARLG